MNFINLDLLKNPLNWITILMMLILFGLFADLILRHYGNLKNSLNPNPVAFSQ